MAELVIDKMPEIAASVAAPLSRVERIVLIGNGGGTSGAERVTKSISEVLAQVPAVVEAMSGIDVHELLKRLPAADPPRDNGAS